ncbi:MAG: hypothetical protein IJ770_02870, partial [Alphaproteobacteria bacterium]|nr:hypothetical protein [Alphaproteobacteria bacterium]
MFLQIFGIILPLAFAAINHTYNIYQKIAAFGSTSKIGAKSSCLRIIKEYNHSSTKNNFRENYSMLKDDIITKNANINIKNSQ